MSISGPINFGFTPIGYIKTRHNTKFSAPHQPLERDGEEHATIELLPRHNFEQALKDLSGFERIWLIWCFHKNREWNPQVRPPRGRAEKRGVFATRSPHRPNPIGMTPVKLIAVKGRKITIAENDLLDGTPILDIKPYIPKYDAFPNSKAGWVEIIDGETASAQFHVSVESLAQKQFNWLKEQNITIEPRVIEILAVDPSPHRTRRITKYREIFRIASGAWRVFFSVKDSAISIIEVRPGYAPKALLDGRLSRIPDREAQLEFMNHWPS